MCCSIVIKYMVQLLPLNYWFTIRHILQERQYAHSLIFVWYVPKYKTTHRWVCCVWINPSRIVTGLQTKVHRCNKLDESIMQSTENRASTNWISTTAEIYNQIKREIHLQRCRNYLSIHSNIADFLWKSFDQVIYSDDRN